MIVSGRRDALADVLLLQPRPHTFNNQAYLPNGATGGPGNTAASSMASNLLPNNGRLVQNGGVRILCVADVRGERYRSELLHTRFLG